MHIINFMEPIIFCRVSNALMAKRILLAAADSPAAECIRFYLSGGGGRAGWTLCGEVKALRALESPTLIIEDPKDEGV